MKAEKTKSGKWRARGYNKYTGSTKSFTRDTKKDAERAARQYEYSVKASPKGLLFGQAYDMYIAAHPNWSPKTIADYTRWKQTRYAEFLDVPIEDMTDELLQLWIDRQLQKMSAKSVVNVLTPIKACLRRYRPRTGVFVVMPKKCSPKLKLPTEGDIMRLIAVVEDTEFCVPVYLAAFCAMRRGEIAALTLDNIDFDSRRISIEHNLAKGSDKWHLKAPKNGETRTITVPQIVIDKIREKGLPTIINPDDFSTKFVRFKREHNLPPFRFHDLRHYCAARMLSMGIPISVVQEYGGWKNKAVLLDIYDYSIKEIRDKSLEKWDAHALNLANNLPLIE